MSHIACVLAVRTLSASVQRLVNAGNTPKPHATFVDVQMSVAPREYLSIALFATSFGFGPVSKAVAVADQIRRVERGAYLAYFGLGSDFEFAKTADVFSEVVEIDVDRPANLSALVHRLSGFDAAVSIMNKALPPHW